MSSVMSDHNFSIEDIQAELLELMTRFHKICVDRGI